MPGKLPRKLSADGMPREIGHVRSGAALTPPGAVAARRAASADRSAW
jgi:hypothetical protein